MKTTIEIADALLAEARELAASRRTTLREIVEEGLRALIAAKRAKPFVLRDCSVGGKGPAVKGWPALRALIYKGRGE